MSRKHTSISSAIGAALNKFRKENDLSLEQVANASQKVGATWGAASIRSIELGEASLTLDRLLQLAFTMRLLNGGTPVTLEGLLGKEDDQLFRLSGTEHSPSVTREWLSRILSGAPVDLDTEGVHAPAHYRAAQFKSRHPEYFNIPENVAPEDLVFVTPTGAEKRAAKNLPISPNLVSIWAQALWGQTLDEEARERAGEDATPQARGRVTRVLTEEIRERLKDETQKTEYLNQEAARNG